MRVRAVDLGGWRRSKHMARTRVRISSGFSAFRECEGELVYQLPDPNMVLVILDCVPNTPMQFARRDFYFV